MDREYNYTADYFRFDSEYTDFPGSVETVFDCVALFENGFMYRDINKLREREAYYAELCA